MKHVGILVVALAGGLAFSSALCAEDVGLKGDPYAMVVARNIFGLNPPPPPNANVSDATPPPKITANGIMSIFGQLQALFKVAGTAKQGVPAVDQSYILSEGQRQDDIEVTKIDEKAGIITFNNHGTVQQLPLEVGKVTSTPLPPDPALPTGNKPAINPTNSTDRQVTANAASQIPPGLTPEVQTIAIEANRLKAQNDGDPNTASMFPTTELTPESSSDGDAKPSP